MLHEHLRRALKYLWPVEDGKMDPETYIGRALEYASDKLNTALVGSELLAPLYIYFSFVAAPMKERADALEENFIAAYNMLFDSR
jgi:hypothetical protein